MNQPPGLDAYWMPFTHSRANQAGSRAQLATLVRRIDAKRFVAGSDYPYAPDPRDHFDRAYTLLPLTLSQWRVLRGNVAPFMRGPRAVPRQHHKRDSR